MVAVVVSVAAVVNVMYACMRRCEQFYVRREAVGQPRRALR